MSGSLTDIARNTVAELSTLLKMPSAGIIGVQPEEGGWLVTAEMLEKKSIPDAMDVLGVYEVHVNASGGIRDFSRTHLRKRGDTT